jgi:hypothetical protein
MPDELLEQLRRDWQEQEDHPLTVPCPCCGSLRNHAVNIDAVLDAAVDNLREALDAKVVEYAYAQMKGTDA